jgi:hypothetical protein
MESQRPLESMSAKVKKDEDENEKEEELDKGLFGSKPPPEKKPFVPSFKGHKAALEVGTTTNEKGVTTERKFDPLKQETSQKKFVNVPFEKTVNGSYGSSVNQGSTGGAMESLSLSKNGQWNLEDMHDEKGRCNSCGNKACDGRDCKVNHAANTMKANEKQNEGFKNKIKGLCPKCHAKKCQCAKDGVLVD